MKKKIILVAAILLITVLVVIYKTRQEQPIEAKFICKNGSFIEAKFYNKTRIVKLALSNGKNFELPQTISADGARYANKDESLVFWNKGDTAFIEEKGVTIFEDCQTKESLTISPQPTGTGIANPASVNCEQKGGQLVIQTKKDNSQYGLCFFDDNRACEEWAMLRGECPIGGVKTTGFATEAQKFCAWSGGQTISAENAVCTFAKGSKCPVDEFYNGTCTK